MARYRCGGILSNVEVLNNYFVVNSNGANTETFAFPSTGKYLIYVLQSSAHTAISDITISSSSKDLRILDEQNITYTAGCEVKAILVKAKEGDTISVTYAGVTGWPIKVFHVFKISNQPIKESENNGTIKCYIDDSGYWHFTNLTVGKIYNAQIHYGNNSTSSGWSSEGVEFTGVMSYTKASATQVDNNYFDWYYVVSFVPSETEVTFKGTGTGAHKSRPQFLIASEDGTEFGCILEQ